MNKIDYHYGAPKYTFQTAKHLRKKQTDSEKILWNELRNRRFNDLKFRRQHPIGRYIVDFYCDERKLVIEIDGGVHASDDQKEYDLARDIYMKEIGLKVLRFKNEDVFNNIDELLKSIK